jgi:hypothetical protein
MAKEPDAVKEVAYQHLTPEEKAAWDEHRSDSGGILLDNDGNVIADYDAEKTGRPPFKTLAEWQAANDRLQTMIAEHRKKKADQGDVDFPQDEDIEGTPP